MKKTIITTVALGFSTVASATNIGTASFQWAGTVPPATVADGSYFIVNGAGTEVLSATDGTMKFANVGGKVSLISASTFDFKVVQDAAGSGGQPFDPATDTTVVPITAKLSSIKAGPGGVVSVGGDDGYFALFADNQPLTVAGKNFAAAPVNVTLKPAIGDSDFAQADDGQTWTVQAAVAVTTQTSRL